MRSLADVMQCADVITGPGVLVKLFPVGDLWIVGSPYAEKWIASKVEEMRTADANTKSSHPVKVRLAPTHAAKTRPNSEKAVTQKKLGSRMRGEKKATEQQVHEYQDESDDESTEAEREEEDEEDEDEEEEDDTGEEDAGEEGAADEDAAKEDGEEEEDVGGKDAAEEEEDAGEDMNEDLDDSEEEKDLEEGPEKDAVMDKENGDDFEEQDDNGHSEPSKQAETAEADKEEVEEYGMEGDLAEDTGDKRQQEAEGQQEAEREVNGDGEETTNDEAQMHNEITGNDDAIQVGQREEHEDDGDKGSVGVHGEVREDREFVERRVAANHPSGVWRSWAPGHANGREETRDTASEGGEGTIEANDGSGEGKRKRDLEGDGAMGTSTLEEYPYKRNKSTREDDESDAVMEASFERGMKTPPRLRTPSPMSCTLSPGSTIKIVRQTSVLPGLQDTENDVRDAAQRDAIFISLSEAHQKNILCTALCLGSEEGIKELEYFVSNARRDGKQGSKALMSGFTTNNLDPDVQSQIINDASDPQSRYLAQVSRLWRRLDDLEKTETLVIITKRVSLATMAQCRESLVPRGVGGNRARDANLKLFRNIFPQHSAVERPEDKVKNPAASQDWIRLRNRLHEGRAWLEVRERFGGLGAFLALPPQCVPDNHVTRLPAKGFDTLLRLLDVAWRALDDRARRTMNALVSFAIEERPLPETTLALERSKVGLSAATAGLSPMLVGWTALDLGAQWSNDSATNPPRNDPVEVKLDTPRTPCTTTVQTDCEEVVAITEPSVRNEMMLAVDGGLFENVDFDEPLSQQI
jgi:hypothetical protein